MRIFSLFQLWIIVLLKIIYAQNQGGLVSCSQASQSCSSCETSNTSNYFTYSSGDQCFVKDCSISTIQSLNGWICNSCYTATGDNNVPKGQYYDSNKNSCVSSCAEGYYANFNTNYDCTFAVPGGAINCSKDNKTCSACEPENLKDSLFTYQKGSLCNVKDCNQSVIGKNLNGQMCVSCNFIKGSTLELGMYYDPKINQCTKACPKGTKANTFTGFICLPIPPIPGSDVKCSINSTDCTGCGSTTAIQILFKLSSGTSCSITDCNSTVVENNLNGWVCNSCSTATGSGLIQKGQYYNPNSQTCTNTCPKGTQASIATGFNCLPPPVLGSDVSCSINSTDCSGCGSTIAIQSLFKFTSGTSCSIADCNSTTIGNNLNGWVCNSCSTATGSNIIQKGQNYDPNSKTCTDTCPQGTQASISTDFICLPIPPIPGSDVKCSINSTDCRGCGSTTAIQILFKLSSGTSCSITDCNSAVVENNLNGWVCNSCSTANGSNIIQKGQYYNPNSQTCTNTCPQGMQASIATGFNCLPPPVLGSDVSCSINSTDCSGCGSTTAIQSLFKFTSGTSCSIADCNSTTIGNNLNGWVCNSCSTATGSNIIQKGQNYDPNSKTCTDTCPQGTQASISTDFICLPIPPIPGSDVTCSINSTDCSGCGSTTEIQNLFKFISGTSCSIADCKSSVIQNNLNGWVCNSCSNATGSNIIQKGQYYDPVSNQCTDSCPQGTQASSLTGFICQISTIPGINVDCSNDSSTCSGCGSTTAIQNLFAHSSGYSCSIKDCTATVIGNNLNGWVCNSCSTASGKNVITTGQFYDGSSCVNSCPNGQTADLSTGYTCKPTQSAIVAAGKPVSCSTDKSTCKSCEKNPSVQNYFQYHSENQCQVIDCSSPKLLQNLNSWVCASCDRVFGSGVPYGKCYNGSTCTSTCQITSNNNANTINDCKVAEFFFLLIIVFFL